MNTLLGLDIGTEFVKAVLARPTERGSLEILAAAKSPQRPGSMHAGAITDISAVVSAAEEALVKVEEAAGTRANLTVVGVAGELIKGRTTSVRYTRKDPGRPITELEMSEILKKVQQKSGTVARDEISLETGKNGVEVRLVNSAVVSLSIDGYKITDPIGFKGSDVSILVYTAFAPLIHVAAIEKVCAELSLDLLTVAVEPFAVSRALVGDQVDSKLSCIIVDVGGTTTNVAVLDDGEIKLTQTFAIGADKIDQSLSVWFSALEVVLGFSRDPGVLPRQIYLCGGGAEKAKLQEQLATSDWYTRSSFPRRPIVDLVDPNDLPDFKIKPNLSLTPDCTTALGLLRVGADTALSAPTEHHLRARFAKILAN